MTTTLTPARPSLRGPARVVVRQHRLTLWIVGGLALAAVVGLIALVLRSSHVAEVFGASNCPVDGGAGRACDQTARTYADSMNTYRRVFDYYAALLVALPTLFSAFVMRPGDRQRAGERHLQDVLDAVGVTRALAGRQAGRTRRAARGRDGRTGRVPPRSAGPRRPPLPVRVVQRAGLRHHRHRPGRARPVRPVRRSGRRTADPARSPRPDRIRARHRRGDGGLHLLPRPPLAPGHGDRPVPGRGIRHLVGGDGPHHRQPANGCRRTCALRSLPRPTTPGAWPTTT